MKRLATRRGARLAVIAGASVLLAVALVNIAGGSPGGGCGNGIPAFKCQPGGPVAGPDNHPTNVPAPPPYWPSPATVDCGGAFFSASTALQLADRFGSISCFRFENAGQWIVIGDGTGASGDDSAPGGAIVAVEDCNGPGRNACLDPNATRPFDDFTVFYPPDPTAWPVRLQTTLGDRLLYLEDGPCGVFTFDLKTVHWFGRSTDVVDTLMKGNGMPDIVAAPAATQGSAALVQQRPAPAGSCAP
jgi:hypothetical protein